METMSPGVPALYSSKEIRSKSEREALSREVVAYLGRLGYRVHRSPFGSASGEGEPLTYVADKEGRRLWFIADGGSGEFLIGAVTHGDRTATVPYLDWSGAIRPEKVAYLFAGVFSQDAAAAAAGKAA